MKGVGFVEMGKKAAVLGAGGLSGRELLRLLRNHPKLEVCHITSDRYAGKSLGEIFQEQGRKSKLTFQKHNSPLPSDSVVFLAGPDEFAREKVPSLVEQGIYFVDLSAAFRFSEGKITYGLPEIFREDIRLSKGIANPGCYPTSIILPLFSLGEWRKNISFISINSASGISGAGGRKEDNGFLYQNVYENFRSYRVLCHQHEPEIQKYASHGMGRQPPYQLVFIPHLLPINRGILTTTVIYWKGSPPQGLEDHFRKLAEIEEFIRFYDSPEEIEIQNVQRTNEIHLSIRTRESISVIVSALDNLVKGAAGQAIQNMNLMLGFPEAMGIDGT